jgi:hypothetical protein
MITELALALSLTFAPAVSGAWLDYDNPIKGGQKLFDSPISLYQGRKYVEEDNRLRYCVRYRESRHAYGANTGTGKFRGAYQFSRKMGVGVGWMIQKELRATGMSKHQAFYIGHELRSNPVNKWAPFWQDMGFWIVWDEGDGADHWSDTNWSARC